MKIYKDSQQTFTIFPQIFTDATIKKILKRSKQIAASVGITFTN